MLQKRTIGSNGAICNLHALCESATISLHRAGRTTIIVVGILPHNSCACKVGPRELFEFQKTVAGVWMRVIHWVMA